VRFPIGKIDSNFFQNIPTASRTKAILNFYPQRFKLGSNVDHSTPELPLLSPYAVRMYIVTALPLRERFCTK
jgi:hypothetical protein